MIRSSPAMPSFFRPHDRILSCHVHRTPDERRFSGIRRFWNARSVAHSPVRLHSRSGLSALPASASPPQRETSRLRRNHEDGRRRIRLRSSDGGSRQRRPHLPPTSRSEPYCPAGLAVSPSPVRGNEPCSHFACITRRSGCGCGMIHAYAPVRHSTGSYTGFRPESE